MLRAQLHQTRSPPFRSQASGVRSQKPDRNAMRRNYPQVGPGKAVQGVERALGRWATPAAPRVRRRQDNRERGLRKCRRVAGLDIALIVACVMQAAGDGQRRQDASSSRSGNGWRAQSVPADDACAREASPWPRAEVPEACV
jgi:hypothetical protein